MSADPTIVCVDTFENDDISGCFEATTTEPCSTGVVNELGGCEPVGAIPPDLEECVGICGPAVVDPSYDPFAVRVNQTTTTTTTTAEIGEPSQLPATGFDAQFGVIAALLIVAGVTIRRFVS